MAPPTFSSADFEWHAGKGTMTLERGLNTTRFPDRFYIKSARTGETRLFVSDAQTMEENEFFDGEGAAYISGDVRVHIWY